MTTVEVSIPMAGGSFPASLHTPISQGPWPAVIMYPDAGGTRQTFRSMADRLTSHGYAVLVPDVYWRSGTWEPFSMETVFTEANERARLFDLMGSLTTDMSVSDAGAMLDFLATRPEVTPGPVGTTGYCMGGRMSLTVAGHHGDRIGAAASFHGGGLAVLDNPGSPHLAAGRTVAVIYVAAAINDASFDAAQQDRLSAAYDAAGVRYTMETYQALHGFAVPDNPTYNQEAEERHWTAMTTLFGSNLTT